jgi:Tol biopolymer transport system component/serine/threonine protein kinase
LTPERWRQITVVFHAARQRDAAVRDAFLDEACASDTTLRSEVDALLAAHGDAGDFGEGTTFAWSEEKPLAPGATLGPYRIEGMLGAGGMGEVYRASDPRLGRTVAIKVLPRPLAADAERRERLLKEARSAAALNHPNICTVHEVGEAEGRDYIVFEHIEGQTLSALKRPGGLPLGQLLDLFLPLSEALDYAHHRGIVHRDLKPANVMVSTLGLPKILDFGVAKGLPRIAGATTATRQTDEGVVIGTAGYMSPEQALGRPVDARSDVFAFAGVLYELASGRRAFEGGSFVEVTDAVLNKDPEPLARLRPDLPLALDTVVRKALRKAPAERCQSMAELTATLRALQAERDQPPSRTVLALRRWARTGSRRVPLLLVVPAAAAGAILAYHRFSGEAPLPRLTNPAAVTVASSVEDYPTWSPDGRTLAYESNESGNWDVWLTQAAGGLPVNRTADHRGQDRYPSWSPDGRQVAFWSERDGGGYYVLPALGGSPQRVAATHAGPGVPCYSPPQWSADGTRLAYVVYEPAGARFDSYVEITSMVTRETRRLPLPGAEECRLDLAWSRDGTLFAYVDAAWQIAETTQLRVLRLADGKSLEITDGRGNVRGPTWAPDGRHVFFTSNRAGPADLWRQRVSETGAPSGPPRQVTTAVEVRHATFSADGGRIAFSKGRWVANVWKVPILESRAAVWADAEQVTDDHAYIEFLDVSRDGRRLLYSSDRAGNQDIWVTTVGKETTRLTSDPAPEWAPMWSPDENAIVFYSARSGDREIWVMPAGGGPARQLTRSPGMDSTGWWSPDGRTIAFRSERTGNSEIWAIARDGTGERQLTHDPAGDYCPAFSPDGRWLAFSSNRGGAMGLWRMPAAGGPAERLSGISTVAPRWSLDGRWLYFGRYEGPPGLWGVSVADREQRLVADLGGRRGSLSFGAPATDGSHLFFSWRADVGDIWVMDVARE